MIRVTLWYEYTQERGIVDEAELPKDMPEEHKKGMLEWLSKSSAEIKETYPEGMANTLAKNLSQDKELEIKVVNLYEPECGLPDEILDNTDVLIWWAHITHDLVPDELVKKIVARIQKGMGFIPLHSAHKSKPFMQILGTSGCLKWREDDRERLWTVNPTHPIAAGIPEYVELPVEEMYGEAFDIPTPDDVVFLGWFAGGEVFRSGCTWTRGYGKIFYFQPGHETNPTYYNKDIIRIIQNAVHWAASTVWRENFDCPNAPKLEK